MRRHLPVLSILLLALALASAPAAEARAPSWRMDALANTTAAPGSSLDYEVEMRNVGDASAEGGSEPIVFSGSLPEGLTVLSLSDERHPWDCSGLVPGQATFSCQLAASIDGEGAGATMDTATVVVEAAVDPLAVPGLRVASFAVSGGGAPAASTVAPATVTEAPPAFGIAAFDAAAAGPSGEPFTAAAAHPASYTTSLAFDTFKSPEPMKGDLTPVEATKDVEVLLPAGLLGDTKGVPRCTIGELANAQLIIARPLCPAASQLGTTLVRVSQTPKLGTGPLPVFNMEPPPGAPARLGFDVLGTIVVVDVVPDPAAGYRLLARSLGVSEGLPVAGTSLTLWGDPADPAHKPQRACPGEQSPWEGGPRCDGSPVEAPFLRMPTSCSAAGTGLPSTLRADSWVHPGAFVSRSIESHEGPGYPHDPSEWGPPQGTGECAPVPFAPGFTAAPTTEAADSPSGLSVHLTVPQDCWGEGQLSSICSSDLRDATVQLPAGMTINPSAAGGRQACSPAQIGLTSPDGSPPVFNGEPANCPDASKLGTVSIKTPLLEEELKGAVYLAKQGDNPFDNLLAMYLVAEGQGVVIKQAGKIEADPQSGRLTTVFEESPQLPFEDLHVSLFGGQRAALRTPSACGTYTTQATLTPWSVNAAVPKESSFQIGEGCGGGFNPKLSAGTENPLAGQTSPFNLRLTREDGEAELAGLTDALPPGLSGYLKGIPYCPDSVLASISEELGTGAAQEANPSCPAASQIGTVTVGAGAGSDPFYTSSGRAYLAGPYKGAPLSLAAVVPAVAGPFDLGTSVVRTALRVDPETAQITAVSDPFPTILHGIPLDLRDVRLSLNRPNFTLNPTSCEPMQIASTVLGTGGASANVSDRFQAADCANLGFKPKLTLKLKGKTTRRAHPALSATLTMPPTNQANIARAQVTLPHAEFLDQGHIRNVCTQVQFKGAGCPASSILGYATAYSPLLDNPLTGPVYLMSGFGHKLPDLAADLNGQIRVLLHGKVDTGPGGGIRNTFEVVPDAPVTKFTLSLKGGNKGLIQNSEDVCAHPQHALALFDAHNGKIHDTSPKIATGCRGKRGKHRH